mmetsp:Transcript_15667/g.45802  ORF Transcript_15667/g.45802 Transcript_15667/m.45802 type:complete len:226 (+) Transcript_15667:345-1022(+)
MLPLPKRASRADTSMGFGGRRARTREPRPPRPAQANHASPAAASLAPALRSSAARLDSPSQWRSPLTTRTLAGRTPPDRSTASSSASTARESPASDWSKSTWARRAATAAKSEASAASKSARWAAGTCTTRSASMVAVHMSSHRHHARSSATGRSQGWKTRRDEPTAPIAARKGPESQLAVTRRPLRACRLSVSASKAKHASSGMPASSMALTTSPKGVSHAWIT